MESLDHSLSAYEIEDESDDDNDDDIDTALPTIHRSKDDCFHPICTKFDIFATSGYAHLSNSVTEREVGFPVCLAIRHSTLTFSISSQYDLADFRVQITNRTRLTCSSLGLLLQLYVLLIEPCCPAQVVIPLLFYGTVSLVCYLST